MKAICLRTGREASLMETCNCALKVNDKIIEFDEICQVGCGFLKECQEFTNKEALEFGIRLHQIMEKWNSDLSFETELNEDTVDELASKLKDELGDLAIIYGVIWNLRKEQHAVRLNEDCYDMANLML
jgi:hypothetical protein